jgi:hypothetical protein
MGYIPALVFASSSTTTAGASVSAGGAKLLVVIVTGFITIAAPFAIIAISIPTSISCLSFVLPLSAQATENASSVPSLRS